MRVSENTRNSETFYGDPFVALNTTAVVGTGWTTTERKIGLDITHASETTDTSVAMLTVVAGTG